MGALGEHVDALRALIRSAGDVISGLTDRIISQRGIFRTADDALPGAIEVVTARVAHPPLVRVAMTDHAVWTVATSDRAVTTVVMSDRPAA